MINNSGKNRPRSLFALLGLMISFITCFLISPLSFATWYQGSAQQKVAGLNYDLDAIRTSTIKQAITNASLKSGVFVSLENIVLDGLLQSSKSVFKNKGDIRRVEILSETINDDLLTVMVKVDIDTSMSCQQDEYTKSVIVTKFPLLTSLQSTNGELFDLGNQVSKRLESQLSSHDAIADVQLINKAFSSIEQLKSLTQQNTVDTSYYLATNYRRQFIAFGFIQDLSLFEQVTDNLLIDDVSLRRNFTFQLYLYDALKNEMLINRRYHGEAHWLFDDHEKIDTNNSVFWRSDYGRVLLNTINSAVIDINDSLRCQTSLSQIVNKEQDKVTITLGAKHGVKIADKFEIIRKKSLRGNQLDTLPLLIPDKNITLEVEYVNHNNAVLVSEHPSVINASQLFDLVSPKGIYPNEK